MASWEWRGRDSRGDLSRGVIDAPSDDAVAVQLMAVGITPLHIAQDSGALHDGAGRRSVWQALVLPAVTPLDMLVFSRQMHTLQKAGVPILRALAGLQASTGKRALAALLADLRDSLDQGRELSTALARHPDVFDGYYVAMIRVGEMTGRLTEAFGILAEHIDSELDMRARVRQALRYPAMVVAAIVVALIVVNLFVLPTFASVFAGLNADLPWVTRALLGFSTWTQKWWPALLATGLAAAWTLRLALRTPVGRYRWDALKLRLPIGGPIVLKATLARFARSFAMASRSGVPLTQAMTVVAQTVDNAWVGRRIEQMRDGIERGEPMSRCAAACGVFTPIVLQMIIVGEETGELDALLLEIAQMFERDTDFAIKGLASAVEPLLLAVIGCFVLLLALGVFMPLWSLGSVASGKA